MVYLDNAATTRPLAEVLEEMHRVAGEAYYNPSSLHLAGAAAQKQLQQVKATIAASLHAASGEILLGPSGTFFNNLAILGGLCGCGRKRGKVVTTCIEHASVQESVKAARELGFTVCFCAPDIEALAREIDEDTLLVSVMMVNNETGLRLPVEQIAQVIQQKNSPALFHIDAVQAYGKIPLDVRKLGCDLLTVSAHKIHGPKGAAALYVKKGTRLCPVIYGGGQEKGLVSGTQNLPAAAGFAIAAKRAMETQAAFYERAEELCQYFIERAEEFPFVQINRNDAPHVPYILNLSFIDYVGENVLHFLSAEDIFVSVGSACSSNTGHGSILSKLGADQKTVEGAIRVSMGRQTTKEDIDAFFAAVEKVPQQLIKKYRR